MPPMMTVLILLVLAQTETVTTKNFEVVGTAADSQYLRQVADALEAAYPTLAAAFGKPAEKSRYRINIYGRLADYEEKDRELNDGRFKHNGAFSHPKTNEAYIFVQPRAGRALLDQTRALLRHETYHLMEHRHETRQGDAPAWLGEGLSERIAEAADRAVLGDAVKGTVNFGDQVTRFRAMRERKRFIPLATLLRDDQSSDSDELSRNLWYSESWLLVKFLEEERSEAWKRFRTRFRERADSEAAAVQKLLLESLGVTVEQLEKDWLAWIATLKPAPWWRVAGDWRLTPDGVEGAAFPDKSAYLMSSEPVKSRRYRIHAEAQLEKAGFGQLDLVVMPSSEDHAARNLVKASVLRSGEASVLIRRNGNWTNVANNKIDPIFVDPKTWVRLELEVNGRAMVFRADGTVLVAHTFKDEVEELHDVRWGVGNYDSWTRFRALDVKSDSK
jgi:hypothetical protein